MSQRHLLLSRRFAPLFWTQFFGAFNDNVFKNALVIAITFREVTVFHIAPVQMVAAAGGIFILPFFLLSATAGQLADRTDKARLIRWIKAAEIAIALIALWGFSQSHFPLLLIVLLGFGLHSTFFGPVKYSILPEHLLQDELVAGNAYIEAGTFLAILLGTLAGGVLVALPSSGPFWTGVLVLFVAAIGFTASTRIPKTEPADPALKVQWNPVTPTYRIFQFAKQDRTVFATLLAISWFWFFGAAMLSLFPSYGKDVLHASSGIVTLFLATFSVGIGIGSALCGILSRKKLELGLVAWGGIGLSFFTAALFFLATAMGEGITVVLLGVAASGGVFIVPLYTLLQERTPLAERSRIIAANNVLNALFMVAAALLLMLGFHLGATVRDLFGLLCVLNTVAVILLLLFCREFTESFLRFRIR